MLPLECMTGEGTAVIECGGTLKSLASREIDRLELAESRHGNQPNSRMSNDRFPRKSGH
jgi:hypothetical protein